LDAGAALKEVRDERLYRVKNGGAFETFEEYCRAVWGMGQRHPHRLIEAYEISLVVLGEKRCPTGHPCDYEMSERILRPLARLPDDAKPEAFRRACAPSQKFSLC
jgi:hypothetical protein